MSSIAVARRTVEEAAAPVIRMLEAAPARGSDLETCINGDFVLGISNPTELREAAMATLDGWAAVTIGTWDNVAEIRRMLETSAEGGGTAGTLIEAFKLFGNDLPGMLRGAFAAVITDGTRFWAFRDHLGFESLFYRVGDGEVWIASEVKQVVAGARMERRPDLDFVEEMFWGELMDEGRCALRGVRRVPKASVLSLDDGKERVRRYWQPESILETGPVARQEITERFHELMDQAVARALTGHDLISLSGGVDSPAVASFAAPLHMEMTGRPLTAYSHVYPRHPTVDERKYIEAVTDHLGLPLHTYEREPVSLAGLQGWVRDFDGPWPGWVPSGAREHLEMARSLGFQNVLTGELAEFVVDQPRYMASHLLLRGRLPALARYLRAESAAGTPTRNLIRQVAGSFVPGPAMSAYRRFRPDIRFPQWLDGRRLIRHRARQVDGTRDRWRARQVAFLRGPGLSLEASFLLQASCGVRTRSPWADIDLWEFFLSLPAEVKYPHPPRKALVREMLRGRVPDVILDRRDKTVFNEYVLKDIDYTSLRRWLVDPPYTIDGVDYGLLRTQLQDESLDMRGYMWAKDLATVNAFLDL